MLEILPEELLDLCWRYCDVFDLRALQLVSRTVSPSATSRLFNQVILLPTKESAAKCLEIMRNDILRLSVATLTLKHDIDEDDRDLVDYSETDDSEAGDGRNEHGTDGPENEIDEEEEDIELPKLYKKCCRSVMDRFSNLQSVEFLFSGNVAAPESEEDHGWGKEVSEWETLEQRNAVMRSIFHKLHQSGVTLKKLAIHNLQDKIVPETVTSDSFKAVLSGLNTLALQIATERDDACPELDLNKSDLHTFFGQDLARVWLQPLQTQLTSLTLYADNYWGYFPVCPLEELHFPRLAHLALGNYSFAFDSQLDWILGHSQTLQSLSLDDCPILHHCTMHCGFLDDRRPRNVKDFSSIYGNDDTWTYAARWHNYFPRIQSGLPKLKKLQFGHGGWDESGGPMDNRHLLGQEIVAGRYVAFHGGTGPSQWIEPRERGILQPDGSWKTGYYYDGCWDEEARPDFPDCEEEDQKALSELLQVLRSRCE